MRPPRACATLSRTPHPALARAKGLAGTGQPRRLCNGVGNPSSLSYPVKQRWGIDTGPGKSAHLPQCRAVHYGLAVTIGAMNGARAGGAGGRGGRGVCGGAGGI
jgi:hypothetical protein